MDELTDLFADTIDNYRRTLVESVYKDFHFWQLTQPLTSNQSSTNTKREEMKANEFTPIPQLLPKHLLISSKQLSKDEIKLHIDEKIDRLNALDDSTVLGKKIADLYNLYMERPSQLTGWEQDFISSISNQYESKRRLSSKQMDCVARLLEKYSI